MSVYVVRAFVQLRAKLATDNEVVKRITKLERSHETHDSVITGLVKAYHKDQNEPRKRSIGFFELEEKEKEKGPPSDDEV